MANVNQERLKLFTDALKSGEFKQARKVLRTSDEAPPPVGIGARYCCLGVATEVALRNGFEPNEDPWVGGDQILSREVADWYGFSDRNPDLIYEGHLESATYCNDGLDATFPAIADLFEKTYGTEAPAAD